MFFMTTLIFIIFSFYMTSTCYHIFIIYFVHLLYVYFVFYITTTFLFYISYIQPFYLIYYHHQYFYVFITTKCI